MSHGPFEKNQDSFSRGEEQTTTWEGEQREAAEHTEELTVRTNESHQPQMKEGRGRTNKKEQRKDEQLEDGEADDLLLLRRLFDA